MQLMQLMQLIQQWGAELLHQQHFYFMRGQISKFLNFSAKSAYFSLAKAHDHGRLQRIID
jgi:hypothetical protein